MPCKTVVWSRYSQVEHSRLVLFGYSSEWRRVSGRGLSRAPGTHSFSLSTLVFLCLLACLSCHIWHTRTRCMAGGRRPYIRGSGHRQTAADRIDCRLSLMIRAMMMSCPLSLIIIYCPLALMMMYCPLSLALEPLLHTPCCLDWLFQPGSSEHCARLRKKSRKILARCAAWREQFDHSFSCKMSLWWKGIPLELCVLPLNKLVGLFFTCGDLSMYTWPAEPIICESELMPDLTLIKSFCILPPLLESCGCRSNSGWCGFCRVQSCLSFSPCHWSLAYLVTRYRSRRKRFINSEGIDIYIPKE
jgi:hypothetical protein